MNRSNAHLFKPFVDALIAGKTVTFRGRVFDELSFDGNLENYAIVEPPKPVPLTHDDMEPGCHLRFPDKESVSLITSYSRKILATDSNRAYFYTEIMKAEIYRPSTLSWSPAHK